MRYWVKAVLGLALFLGGLAAFEYALYELMNIGTCASGGPYVSARECPEGTAQTALLMPGGFILGMIGVMVFALRGRRPGAGDDAWRASPWLLGWAPLFVVTGAVALVAGLESDGADASTLRWTGIFLAVLFIPMGLVPVLGTLFIRGSRRGGFDPITTQVIRNGERAAATPPAATPHAGADALTGDPVERLQKLGRLRDAGVLTPAEFDAAKSRILAEL